MAVIPAFVCQGTREKNCKSPSIHSKDDIIYHEGLAKRLIEDK
jgi:hypothetical protein